MTWLPTSLGNIGTAIGRVKRPLPDRKSDNEQWIDRCVQDVEILRGDDAETVHTGRIIPVHAATEGVSARTIRELAYRALQQLGPIPDPFPEEAIGPERLVTEDEALRAVHFPDVPAQLERAVDRLKFDELFTLELGVAYRKRRVERTERGVAHTVEGTLVDRFLANLPFDLTSAQRRAIRREATRDRGCRRRPR